MTGAGRLRLAMGSALLLGALCVFTPGQGRSQSPGDSARSLIDALTHQRSGRLHGDSIATCGSLYADFRESRAMADALVNLGEPATPDIESALDSISSEGSASPFAQNGDLLGYAYARIRGPAAYARIRAIINTPRTGFLRQGFTKSVSIAFGLTSYVDSSIEPARGGCRAPEPRDGLNALIAAWQRDDRAKLESDIGPRARAALQGMLSAANWVTLRARLWPGSPAPQIAIGYTLELPGPWGAADGSAQQTDAPVDLAQYPRDPQVETYFCDGSGNRCGKYTVRFRRVRTDFLPKYAVDNPDLEGLLRVISSCTTDVSLKR
jgi:hypothetical protein